MPICCLFHPRSKAKRRRATCGGFPKSLSEPIDPMFKLMLVEIGDWDRDDACQQLQDRVDALEAVIEQIRR